MASSTTAAAGGGAGADSGAASLRRLAAAVESFAAQLQCAICLCAYANPSSLPCNHCFCEECIHRALELKPVCPICKAPAKKRKLRFDSMISQLLRATDMLSAPSPATALPSSPSAALEEKPPAPAAPLQQPSASGPTEPPRTQTAPKAAISKRPSSQSLGAPRGRKTERRTSGAAPPGSPKARASEPPALEANGAAAATNGTAPHEAPALNGPFEKDELVEVASRTWIGINKPGGAARITHVNGDHTYGVKYVLDSRREQRIPDAFITKPSAALAIDVTPGRAVKQRQRRPTKYALSGDSASSSDEEEQELQVASPARVAGPVTGKRKRSALVFLCSGYDDRGTNEIAKWAAALDAEIVASWSARVTHLIVKCVAGDKPSSASGHDDAEPVTAGGSRVYGKRQLFSDAPSATRWVKIRSMKYLKALVGGRWIVSEEWLQACATRGELVSEAPYEADGHLKGRNIHDAVRRSRKRRQANLQTKPADVDADSVGTELFAAFCFHLVGDFLPPMPPQSELDTLLSIGGAARIRSLDDVATELAQRAHRGRQLVIVSDRINPVGLRDLAKHLKALPQLAAIRDVAIVNYQWVLNSISEAKLRPLK